MLLFTILCLSGILIPDLPDLNRRIFLHVCITEHLISGDCSVYYLVYRYILMLGAKDTEVRILKQLKIYTITGTVFVLVLGTLSHFFYQWSNQNFFAGLFFPINESTWEHMKLLFFPMFLYSLMTAPILKKHYPCNRYSFSAGILTGTFMIPVIFYTYTGILGYHIFILDIGTFVLSVLIAFYTVYRLSRICPESECRFLFIFATLLLAAGFIVFSCFPLNLGLFSEPL